MQTVISRSLVVLDWRDEYRGYALTGLQDALFRIVRDPAHRVSRSHARRCQWAVRGA